MQSNILPAFLKKTGKSPQRSIKTACNRRMQHNFTSRSSVVKAEKLKPLWEHLSTDFQPTSAHTPTRLEFVLKTQFIPACVGHKLVWSFSDRVQVCKQLWKRVIISQSKTNSPYMERPANFVLEKKDCLLINEVYRFSRIYGVFMNHS